MLPAMSPESSASARRQLERLGVEVSTEAPVTAIDDRGVTHGGARLDSRTVIWAAGVAASPLGKALGAEVKLDRAGRVIVNQDLTVAGPGGRVVIGDLASIRRAASRCRDCRRRRCRKGGRRPGTSCD